MRRRNTEPFAVDPSPLYRVGDRVPLLAEGHYTWNCAGAYDPRYSCECDRAEGIHPRADCGTPE